MDGVLILDKPQGFTSFDAVAVMRRLCGQKKIGHTGTLDPMATGVLPLLLGKATRAASLLEDTDKEYEAGFRFGVSTDTQDGTGKVLRECAAPVPHERLEAVLPAFRGEILQVPPMYSAVHQDGQRLYELARKGIEVERAPRPVTVYRLELNEYDEAARSGRLTVRCSKGTYIRALCADIGDRLGAGGVMTSLRRTSASGFTLADAVTPERARELAAEGTLAGRVLPVETLFSARPPVRVTVAQARRFCSGGALFLDRTGIPPEQREDGAVFRVLSPAGEFLGLGQVNTVKGELSVLRLFCSVPDGAAQESMGG